MVISRRSALTGVVCALAAPYINRGRFRLFAGSPAEYSTHAIDIVRGSCVVDMLGLVTLDYRRLCDWQMGTTPFLPADFERLRASGITAMSPAVGFTEGDVYRSSRNDLLRWNLFIANHPDKFVRVDRVESLDLAKLSGRIGIILGLQNSSHFRRLDDVDLFHAMGQRVSQLTYFDNALGGGSTAPSRGLTEYGAQVVARMNQLGMAVDISHCSDRTTLDAISASGKPVLVTHSNCRRLAAGSARCKTDEAIRSLAAKGGVFGVTMVRYFVRSSGAAGLQDMLDHIDHVVSLAGIEHAGLGTDVDLDGRDHGSTRRQDLDGVDYSRKVYDVAEGLLRRNYTPEQVGLVLGGNFRRVLRDIWNI